MLTFSLLKYRNITQSERFSLLPEKPIIVFSNKRHREKLKGQKSDQKFRFQRIVGGDIALTF